MRSIITILLLFLSYVAWSQRYDIVSQQICWNTGSVDSSLNRIFLVSTRSSQIKQLGYLNSNAQKVDVSGGGSFSQGYCGCCGGGSGSSGGDGQGLVNAKNGLSLEGDSVILGGMLKMNTSIAGMDTYGLDLTTLSYLTLSGKDSLRLITPDLLSAVADIGGVLQLNSATGRVQYTPYAFPLVIGTNGQYMEWDAAGDSLKWTSPFITAVATDSSYRFSINGSSVSEVLFKNIYTQDDTLTSDRTANLDGKKLVFYDTGNGHFQVVSGNDLGMMSIKRFNATDSLVFRFDSGFGGDYGLYLDGPLGQREIFSATEGKLSIGVGFTEINLEPDALDNDTSLVPNLISIDPVTRKLKKSNGRNLIRSLAYPRLNIIEETGDNFRRSDQSTIVRINGDTLMLAYQVIIGSGFDDADGAIWKRMSYDGGFTWSEPDSLFTVFTPGLTMDTVGINSPNLLMVNDTLHAIVAGKEVSDENTGPAVPYDDFDLKYSRSLDGGETWSTFVDLTNDTIKNVITSQRLFLSTTGRLIMPYSYALTSGGSSSRLAEIRFLYSDDNGVTWDTIQAPNLKGPDSGFATEPGLYDANRSSSQETLVCYFRDRDGYTYAAYSRDDAETWSEPVRFFPNSNSQSAVIRNDKYDTHIRSYNGLRYENFPQTFGDQVSESEKSTRRTLFLGASIDGGNSWADVPIDGDDGGGAEWFYEPTIWVDSIRNNVHLFYSVDTTETAGFTDVSMVQQIIPMEWFQSVSAPNTGADIPKYYEQTYLYQGEDWRRDYQKLDGTTFFRLDPTGTYLDGKIQFGDHTYNPLSVDFSFMGGAQNIALFERAGGSYKGIYFDSRTDRFNILMRGSNTGFQLRDSYSALLVGGSESLRAEADLITSSKNHRFLGELRTEDNWIINDANDTGEGVFVDDNGLLYFGRDNTNNSTLGTGQGDTQFGFEYQSPTITINDLDESNPSSSYARIEFAAQDSAHSYLYTSGDTMYLTTDLSYLYIGGEEVSVNGLSVVSGFGSESGVTDASGDITVAHSLGTATVYVAATATGTTFYNVQVHTKTSTEFKVRFFDATGAAITSTAVTVDWIARK